MIPVKKLTRIRKGPAVILFAALGGLAAGGARWLAAQNTGQLRTQPDYMTSYLQRNTRPLGLKEDRLQQRLLRQSDRKWAIRAGSRHILD